MDRAGLPIFLVVVTLTIVYGACGSSSPSSPTSGAPAGTTVTITSNGVNPAAMTVKPGSQVTFVNNDSRSHNIASNPHPEHTDCPAINDVGVLSPGQSRQTGNLNLVRTCGYHDHDDSENTRWKGTITIQ